MKDKIQAIICDMDGCLVRYPHSPFYSSWDALSAVFSEEKRKKWFAIRDYYFGKKELVKEWYKEQITLLTGIKVEEALKYLFPVPYNQGVREFFNRKNKYIKGIISSGLSLVAERISEELGFDFAVSDLIEVQNGRFTGKGEPKINLWRKDIELKKIAEERRFLLGRTLYVGDHENDIPCFEIVGISVAFNPKTKKTAEAADYIIDDFRELEKILKLENAD